MLVDEALVRTRGVDQTIHGQVDHGRSIHAPRFHGDDHKQLRGSAGRWRPQGNSHGERGVEGEAGCFDIDIGSLHPVAWARSK